MTPAIHWRYHRANCMSCSKAQAFLTQHGIESVEPINARKVAIGPEAALALLSDASVLSVVQGRKVYDFNLATERPDDETLLNLIIGRSGNLRAPALRVGTTLVVGFDATLYVRLMR